MTLKLTRVAVAGLLAALSAGQAFALIKKFPGYYEINSNFTNCNTPTRTFCRADFDELPANQSILVNRIGCKIQHVGAINELAFGSTESPSGGNPISTFPLAIPTSVFKDGTRHSSFNQDLFYRVAGGTVPTVTVETLDPGPIFVSCLIVGTPAKD